MECRVAVFVDGANMFYAQKKARFFIDYARVVELVKKDGVLYKPFFYIGSTVPPEARAEKFLNYLIYRCGFTVREKKVKTIVEEDTGNIVKKCNLDIEIAIDMFNTIDNYDLAYLFSGDGDFERVVELLRTRGKRVFVVASRFMLARELANAADRVIYLEDLQEAICRTDREPESHQGELCTPSAGPKSE